MELLNETALLSGEVPVFMRPIPLAAQYIVDIVGTGSELLTDWAADNTILAALAAGGAAVGIGSAFESTPALNGLTNSLTLPIPMFFDNVFGTYEITGITFTYQIDPVKANEVSFTITGRF